jgi:4-amino-4-deoxy-L-arabinose transferase-like glycosyltransferase
MKKSNYLFLNDFHVLAEKPFDKNEILSISVIIFLKIVFMAIMLMDGFIGLSNDDFARQLAGYSWAKDPFLFKSGWPPLQFWILGLFLKIFSNVSAVNLFVNGLFSILALLMLYYLIRLFFDKKIALLTLLIAAILPWQLKLSLSGLTEPIYHFFLFSSLYFLFKWEISPKRYLLVFSAFAMLLGTMLRIDAWIFYIAVSIYLLFKLFVSTKSYIKINDLLILILLPLTFIIIWLMLGKFQTNYQVFQQEHISSSSMLSPIHVRILRYPGYLFLISPFIAALGIIGLYPFIKRNKNLSLHYLFIPILYFLGMIGASVITGAGTLSAPVRLVLPFIYILIPISLLIFFNLNKQSLSKFGIMYLLILFLWSIYFSFNYNKNDFVDISNVSKKINTAWSIGIISEDQKIYMEKNRTRPYHGDHLAFKTLSKYPGNVDIYENMQDSISVNLLVKNAKKESVAAYVACGIDLKTRLMKLGLPITNVGPYTVFWNNIQQEAAQQGDVLKSRPTTNITNIKFASGWELIGFNIEHGDFPSGVTTYWKMDSVGALLNIEYGIKQSGKSQEYFILGSHNIGYNENIEELSSINLIINWQKLRLPAKLIPGKYTLALRTSDINTDLNENNVTAGFSEWNSLTDIYIINDKRQVFNRLAKGKLDDYTLAAKVIASIF